jgi:hypothetical protein
MEARGSRDLDEFDWSREEQGGSTGEGGRWLTSFSTTERDDGTAFSTVEGGGERREEGREEGGERERDMREE